jgi:hypothetical protein
MQLTIRVSIFLAFIFVSGFSMANDAETEIKQMLNFLADEWTEGDLDSIRGHIHRDFVLVTSDGARTREDRLIELAEIMTPGQDHGELSYSDIEVKPLTEDYALAYGRSRLSFKDGTELSSVFSSAYTKTPFGWRVILTHE